MIHLRIIVYCWLCIVFCAVKLSGAVHIDFNFIDPPGTGFNKPNNTWAKEAVNEAGQVFSTWLVGDASLVIDVVALEHQFDSGTSYPLYRESPDSNLLIDYPRYIVLNGLNYSHASVGFMRLNLNCPWGNASKSIKSTALHELTHLFGFKSEGVRDYCDPKSLASSYTLYDTFITDAKSTPLILDGQFNDQYNCSATPSCFTGLQSTRANDNDSLVLESFGELKDWTHLNGSLYKKSLMSPSQFLILMEWNKYETAVMRDLGLCVVNSHSDDSQTCNSPALPLKKINLSHQQILVGDRLFEVFLNGTSAADSSMGNQYTEVLIKTEGSEVIRHPLNTPQGHVKQYTIGDSAYSITVDVLEEDQYQVSVEIQEHTLLQTLYSTRYDLNYYANEGFIPVYMYFDQKTVGNRTFRVTLDKHKQVNLFDYCRSSHIECLGYVNPDSELVLKTSDEEIGRFRIGLSSLSMHFIYTAEDACYDIIVDYYPRRDRVNAYLSVEKISP